MFVRLSHILPFFMAALILGGILAPWQTLQACAYDALPSDTYAEEWLNLEPGLDFAIFDLNEEHTRQLIVLRIEPARFVFKLFSASADGGKARSLRQWAQQHKLTAVINASLFLEGQLTSTGYLRQENHVNKGYVTRNLNAIFLAEPMRDNLPYVTICDKTVSPCRERIEDYKYVVQNYRLINAKREITWHNYAKPVSISAVGIDGQGRILFLHCREPLRIRDFAQYLLDLPLDIHTTMYVEGSSPAGLFINTPRLTHGWNGRHFAELLTYGTIHVPIPNVLGIVPRKVQEDSPKIQK